MRAASIAILSAFIIVLPASRALSDGGFFWNEGADLSEPEQLAVLYHDGENETLILRVKYLGEAHDFAWVVPLPSEPEIEVVEVRKPAAGEPSSVFGELSQFTQLRERSSAHRTRDDLSSAESTVAMSDVEVIARELVGIYDIAVLRASAADPLIEWLSSNGFAFPDDRSDVLDHYVQKNWVFVASRVAPGELTDQVELDMREGTLQPLLFRFASDRAVYPLRMSAVNSGETELLIFVLSGSPLAPATGPHTAEISLGHNVCEFRQLGADLVDPEFGTHARVDSSGIPLTWSSVRPQNDGVHLCKYRVSYESADMVDDIEFTRFRPVDYWEGVRDTASAPDDLAIASWVLAWHSPRLLIELAGSDDALQRCAAAYSGQASGGILRSLASDREREVRWMVASNRRSPHDVLLSLAEDRTTSVREAVAGNPSTPESALVILARDSQKPVRTRVSAHPLAGERVWKLWTDSTRPTIRIDAATYPSVPVEVLERFAEDRHVEVRKRVARRPDLPAGLRMRLAQDDEVAVREALVRSCREDEGAVLTFLAGDSESSVREAVAWYWRTPLEALTQLAGDPSPAVRSKVAMNRVTLKADIVRLAEDPDASVRKEAYHGLRVRGFSPDEAEAMTGYSPEVGGARRP